MKNITCELPEAPGVFVDSAVIDQFSNLVFASLWGHTASIQTTIARIVAGDLTTIRVNDKEIFVNKEMVKKAGKLPQNNAYGDMTHSLIYRQTAMKEESGRRELLFYGTPPEELIFQAIQSLSTLPLLDNWCKHLLISLRDKEMLVDLKTICGDIYGVHISLIDEEFEILISEQIKSKKLEI